MSAFCRLFSTRRVGAQQPVSRRGIVTNFPRAAIWLLVILLGMAGILYAVMADCAQWQWQTPLTVLGWLLGVDGADIWPDRDGQGQLYAGIEQLTTVHAEKLNSVGGPTDPCRLARHLPV